ncbi:Uncharacterized protein Adt_10566 [Abeliophyllum distichum]|uniref:Thionin-like protein n=1 Tax=Abeliophyllum distichum TaxID=126358 RepID=A0ABD1UKI6_9LAMI
MECNRGGIYRLMVVLMPLMLTSVVVAPDIYGCWGGCFNECFIGSHKIPSKSFACHLKCLDSCVPRSATDYQYYCQIGCSLKRCIFVSYDGALMEKCFGKCTDICKKII